MSEQKHEDGDTPEEKGSFTDAYYNSQDESPAAPHVYGSASAHRRSHPPIQRPAAVASLCAAAALLGLLLGYNRIRTARTEIRETVPETVETEAEAPAFSLEPEDTGNVSADLSEDSAYLGIVAQTVPTTVVSYYNWDNNNGSALEEGARICAVQSGSAAEKAGLETGDIIVSLGAYSVRSEQDLATALETCRAGSQTTVTYYRDGKTFLVNVRLGARGDETAAEENSYFGGFAEDRRR